MIKIVIVFYSGVRDLDGWAERLTDDHPDGARIQKVKSDDGKGTGSFEGPH